MRDWMIIMFLQTTLVKAYSLNQTSYRSPQFQICTVTPVSQCHVLTYRQSRDRRLVCSEWGPSAMWWSPGGARHVSVMVQLCFGIHPVQWYSRGGHVNEIIVFCRRKLGRKKCQPNVACLYALRKGGHTFPFNDRPRFKTWIVART